MPLSKKHPLIASISGQTKFDGGCFRERLWWRWAVVAVACACILAYWPGLQGGFLFDDYANLPALGRYGGVRDGASLLWYLTSGIADPSGRPISLLSFLLDARSWPAEPWSFKRTNLVIHLLNGAALLWVLRALGQRYGLADGRARWAALIGAGLWMLHPIWVSTVLYVVQRQAMLAALFVLLGLRAWLAAGDAFAIGRVRAGWGFTLVAIPICGLLAGLSKANGFLLPLLALVVEFVLPARSDAFVLPASARKARLLLLWAPSLAVLAYVVVGGLSAGEGVVARRGWSVAQRLLTEPRALWDYALHLALPTLPARGVFADSFEVSRGLFTPWTTFPAVLALGVVAGFAFAMRKRLPLLSLAVLFFLAAHSMESSFLPLELYFEHRNYLPATLMFWPIALCLVNAVQRWRIVAWAGGTGFVGLALLVWGQACMWGQPLQLAHYWASQNPASVRSQAYAATMDLASGQAYAAVARLTPLARAEPTELQYAVPLVDAYCREGRVPNGVIEGAVVALAASGVHADLANQWISSLLVDTVDDVVPCAGLPAKVVERLAAAALERAPANIEDVARANHIRGLLELRSRNCAGAYAAFQRQIEVQPRPEFVQANTIRLASTCGDRVGAALLHGYLAAGSPVQRSGSPVLRLRDWLMRRYWMREWERLGKVMGGGASQLVEDDTIALPSHR